jgi:hypothetical protein
MKSVFSFLLVSLLLQSSNSFAANEISNREQLRQRYGLSQYDRSISKGSLASLKIAILDNGFAGFEAGRGLLPSSAELIEGPANPQAPSGHGLGMAQIVWAMTGMVPEGPKFYLVNTNGFSNLKAAVDFAVRQKVDIILYSQVWPFGGNLDGTGFINSLVERATSAGILWINAAGNDHNRVYNGRVQDLKSGAAPKELRFENKLDENSITVVLTWTDFRDTESYNTNKDLDLFVYDQNDRLVGSSELIQRGEAPPADGSSSKLSSHARESLSLARLDRGNYRIRIVNRSNNFSSSDRFRVLVRADRPDSVIFTDHSGESEIMPPADHPKAFTVGEQSAESSVGPTLDGRTKPDTLIADATVAFTNGSQTRGSSNAAAILTGAIALMKVSCPSLQHESLANYATTLRTTWGMEELLPVDYRTVHPSVIAMVPPGGRVVMHRNGHLVILTPVDPLELPVFRNRNAYRINPDDILVISPFENRWYGFFRNQAPMIRAPLIEFRQLQQGEWRTPAPGAVCSG